MTVWISIALAAIAFVAVGGALWNRIATKKGIGWQFIRYTVIGVTIPVAGILALNGALTGEASTLLGMAMAYAFGKSQEAS